MLSKNNNFLINILLILTLISIFLLVGIGKLADGWFALMVGFIFGYVIAIEKNKNENK